MIPLKSRNENEQIGHTSAAKGGSPYYLPKSLDGLSMPADVRSALAAISVPRDVECRERHHMSAAPKIATEIPNRGRPLAIVSQVKNSMVITRTHQPTSPIVRGERGGPSAATFRSFLSKRESAGPFPDGVERERRTSVD